MKSKAFFFSVWIINTHTYVYNICIYIYITHNISSKIKMVDFFKIL